MIRGKEALADDKGKSFALTFVTAITSSLQNGTYGENGFHVHD
jgi:hypothetical protein